MPDDERKEYKKTKNTVPYAGRVFGCEEVEAVVDSALEFWLTLGKKGIQFEKLFERFGLKSSLWNPDQVQT